ncbi:MAG: PucR family transcriptional regulator ligand-binding domain-containing protein [Gudongella sp.]|nr:PucR family transcriptional regulator ligand-binding domain-containing protein [Gudongella sp.]
MGILLNNILQLNCFKNAKILSGNQMIPKTSVEGITIVERPDIADWIKGGELLLTSFYSIDRDIKAQKKLVSEVAKNGAAGIIIKISDTFPEVSCELIEIGKELQFPIIEISKETKYIDILYPVMGELFNEQVNRLNYYKECHEKFNDIALKMKGIESIAKSLQDLVDNPVIIFDNEMRVLAYSNPDYSEIYIVEKKMRKMVYKGYPIYGIDMKFQNSEELKHLIVEPIEVVNKIKAYIGIVEVTKELNELDFIAVESAANALRLEILKETAVNSAKLIYKGDLMDDLINNNYSSKQTIYDRGSLLGWDLKKEYTIGIFSLCRNKEKTKLTDTEWFMESRETAITIIDRIAYHHTTGHISLIKGDEIIVFWPSNGINKDKSGSKSLKEFGEEVRETIKKRLGKVTVSLGIGESASDVSIIGESYKQAKDALVFGTRISGEDATSIYEELGIYKILCSFQDREMLSDFIPDSLRRLQEYDRDKNNELIDTFQMYLKCNLNAVKTAEELFVHYKTVLYRLNRIKEITNLDIEDRDKMLEVEVGLKILKILDK